MDSAMPIHTLSPQFCPEIAQARSSNEIAATPQKSLPATSKFLSMISLSSRRDLRAQEAVKQLEASNERG
jgi:hypothetical protein